MQVNNFANRNVHSLTSTNLQKQLDVRLPVKQDQVCFKGDLESLQKKVQEAKFALLNDARPASQPIEVVQHAERLAKANSTTMWTSYRTVTQKFGTPIPDYCFIKLTDNVVGQLTKKDSFWQKALQSYFNKKNKSGKINKFDKIFDKFIEKLGIENKKAYVLSLVDMFVLEASPKQNELLKASLQLHKDDIYNATNADILKEKVDRLITHINLD